MNIKLLKDVVAGQNIYICVPISPSPSNLTLSNTSMKSRTEIPIQILIKYPQQNIQIWAKNKIQIEEGGRAPFALCMKFDYVSDLGIVLELFS